MNWFLIAVPTPVLCEEIKFFFVFAALQEGGNLTANLPKMFGSCFLAKRHCFRQLVSALKAVPGTLDVRHDWENKVLKILVVVDQARARRAGITSRDVALSLEAHLDGVQATDYREGDVAIPVIFRLK